MYLAPQLYCWQVPCINSEYGCPVTLPRRLRAAHLVSCPASVVLCMAEWNRWPRSRPDSGAGGPDSGAQPNGVDEDGQHNRSELVGGSSQWEEIEQRDDADVSKSLKELDQNGKVAVESGSVDSLPALRNDNTVVGNAEKLDYLLTPIGKRKGNLQCSLIS